MEFVAEDRRIESLAAYYASLTDAQRAALQGVAMDMWPAYIRATEDGLPDGAAKIVFNRLCAAAHNQSWTKLLRGRR